MVFIAQGARFFEMLGYLLGVLAFGILLAGVLWSLRLHVSQERRTLFLVASFAGLITLCAGALLWLVLSQPLGPDLPTRRGI